MPIAYAWNDFTISLTFLCLALLVSGAVLALATARLFERTSTTEKACSLICIVAAVFLSWFFIDAIIQIVHSVLIIKPVGYKYT